MKGATFFTSNAKDDEESSSSDEEKVLNLRTFQTNTKLSKRVFGATPKPVQPENVEEKETTESNRHEKPKGGIKRFHHQTESNPDHVKKITKNEDPWSQFAHKRHKPSY